MLQRLNKALSQLDDDWIIFLEYHAKQFAICIVIAMLLGAGLGIAKGSKILAESWARQKTEEDRLKARETEVRMLELELSQENLMDEIERRKRVRTAQKYELQWSTQY